MTVTTQPSAVKFLAQVESNDGNNDADLNAIHGLVSMDIIKAAAAINTGIAPNALKSASATGGVGYSTGAGGVVTQASSSSTGVTLSKPCGQITTVALTTAAAAEERFTVTNTLVAATDVVAVGTTYAGNGTPAVSVMATTAGTFDIVITNLHASSALNAALVVNFAVIKAVAA